MDKTVAPILEDMVEHAYKTQPIDVLGFMIDHLQAVRELSPTPSRLAQRSAQRVTTFAGMSQRLLVLEDSGARCSLQWFLRIPKESHPACGRTLVCVYCTAGPWVRETVAAFADREAECARCLASRRCKAGGPAGQCVGELELPGEQSSTAGPGGTAVTPLADRQTEDRLKTD